MVHQTVVTVDVSEHYLGRVHDILATIPGAHSFAVAFTPEPDGTYLVTASVVVQRRPYPGQPKATTTYNGTAVRREGELFRSAVTAACVDMLHQIRAEA